MCLEPRGIHVSRTQRYIYIHIYIVDFSRQQQTGTNTKSETRPLSQLSSQLLLVEPKAAL